MDEIWSIELAMGRGSVHDNLPPDVIRFDQPDLTSPASAAPWWSILTHLAGVPHLPAYPLLLRWWIDLFGESALATRSLSAIFSLGVIVLLFDLCRFLHGQKIALFSAAICACAIAQLDFAQEARVYPMLMFLGLSCADLLVRIEYLGVSRKRIVALFVCLFLTTMTHYLAAGALAALALYSVVRLRRPARAKTMLAFSLGIALSLAVLLPLFIQQSRTLPSMAPGYLSEANPEQHVKLTLFRLIGLPAQFLVGETLARTMSASLVLSIFLFTIVLPLARLAFRRDLLLWVLWILGAVGFVAAIDLARQTTLLAFLRYTILASPAVYAVVAAFDWPKRPLVRDAIALATIALLATLATRRAVHGVPPKEDWRRLSRDINGFAAPGDLLVFHNADPWISSGTWYMAFKYYEPNSKHPWLILSDHPGPDLLRQLHTRPCLWLIGKYPEMEGPQLLPGWRPQMLVETSAGRACRMVPQ